MTLPLLHPKEVEIPTLDGEMRTYIISRLPAIPGREVAVQYLPSAAPKVGDYHLNETLMRKLMCYVGVPREGADPLMLTTDALVNNHIPDWQTLCRLELAMMDHNTSFFRNGKASIFLRGLGTKAESKITVMLTGLLEKLSQAVEQHFTSSGQSTPSKKPFRFGKQ